MLKSIISLHSANKNPIYISVTEKEREFKKRERRGRKKKQQQEITYSMLSSYIFDWQTGRTIS